MTILAHDLIVPIQSAEEKAGFLYKNISAGNRSPELAETAKKLTRETQEIYQFIEEFLIWMSFKKGIYLPRFEKFSLNQMLSELLNNFENSLLTNANTIEMIIPGEEELFLDKSVLKILCRNLIDNANKNTQGGKISIRLSHTAEGIRLSVEDNGKGMTEEEIRKLLRGNEIASGTAIKGFGFRIVRDLVTILHGELRVASEPGMGTRVEIHFPTVKPA